MLVHAGETHPPQSARVLFDIRVSAKCSKSLKREDLCHCSVIQRVAGFLSSSGKRCREFCAFLQMNLAGTTLL